MDGSFGEDIGKVFLWALRLALAFIIVTPVLIVVIVVLLLTT